MSDINKVVEILNGILATDPKAVKELLLNRVPCNEAMADHNTVQVIDKDGEFSVGMLGILNGVIEPLTGRRVAVISDDGDITGFMVYPLAAKLRLTVDEESVFNL